MNQIFNLKFTPLILFILIIPAFFFMLRPGIYWNMHDDMQIIRQLEMEKCILDGQIPCRWTPDLGYGYGYPLFNFYPPLPYLVGQVFRIFGLSFVTTVKLTAALQIIVSALGMYLATSLIFGPLGGLLAGLFYTYAPYHAVNIYVRGAMNEAWAAAFFPFIFYFAKKLIDTSHPRNILMLGISFAGLMLSHNPMTLIFTPTLCVWVIYWLIIKFWKNPRQALPTIIKLVLSGFLAFGLAAFYTLPVLFESKYVQIESMFTNYYHFSIHFVSLYQLFLSRYWGDGPSVWGTDDQMSFAIGYLQWTIPLLLCFFALIKFIRLRRLDSISTIAIIVATMGLFSAFMSHERSTFIWLWLTPVQKIQFPWRFLNLTTFLFSFSVGLLPLLLNFQKHLKVTLFTMLIVVVTLFVINLGYFNPLHQGPITDQQKLSGLAWRNLVTSGIYDYLPKTARIAALGPAAEFIDQVTPQTVAITNLNGQKGTNWQLINFTLDKPATIFLATLAFPGLVINDNQQIITYQIEPELGRPSLKLEAGTHQIYLKYSNTPIRTLSNLITLITLTTIGLLLLKPIIWKK